MDVAQGANAHVKKTLPPTLSGHPGEAEIQYYVKATVQRPAFYKENFRAHANFMFFPIEPPRPPPNRRESYARVQHQFAPPIDLPEKSGLFRRQSTPPRSNAPMTPPSISVEGRLPDPAIITCNEALPLRILITKQNDTTATLYLQMINVELLAFTSVRAQQLRRNEITSRPILSRSNMHMPMNEGSDSKVSSKALEVDSKLWKQMPLPNTVAPTFYTCNISRTYGLYIKVGLTWGVGSKLNVRYIIHTLHGNALLTSAKPELTVQTLRMPVQVYSGMAPTQALLAAMANRANQPPSQDIPPPLPFRPSASNGGLPTYAQPTPAQGTDHIEPSPSDIPPDAPPSYEDAIADNMGPIDGPRREYRQDEVRDEKGGGRLFPDGGT